MLIATASQVCQLLQVKFSLSLLTDAKPHSKHWLYTTIHLIPPQFKSNSSATLCLPGKMKTWFYFNLFRNETSQRQKLLLPFTVLLRDSEIASNFFFFGKDMQDLTAFCWKLLARSLQDTKHVNAVTWADVLSLPKREKERGWFSH